MKLRTRAIGFAATAGFAAASFAMAAPSVHAAPVLSLSCTKIHGVSTLKPGITFDNTVQAIGVKQDKLLSGGGTGPDPACTSSGLPAIGALDAFSINLKAVGPTLVNIGTETCYRANALIPPHVPTGTAYPMSGAGKLVFHGTFVSPTGPKAYSSAFYVTETPGPDQTNRPEEVVYKGLVTKGVGVGGAFEMHVLSQPIPTKVLPAQPKVPVLIPPQINVATGDMSPTIDSGVAGAACSSGGTFPLIPTVTVTTLLANQFSTQGTSLASLFAPDPGNVLSPANGGKLTIDL